MRERLRMLSLTVLLIGIPVAGLGDEVLRDPTRPYFVNEAGVPAAPRFTVNAIIVSAERRIAIVNGRRVAVGGSVDGATVLAIEKDHLVLEKNGERVTAALQNGVSRQ